MSATRTALTIAMTPQQRLATFIAAQAHNMFPIAESFAAACRPFAPALAARINLTTKAARFDFAMLACDLCKNAATLDDSSPLTRTLRNRVARAGVTDAELPRVRAALLTAIRRHAGADFDERVAAGLNGLLDRCFDVAPATLSANQPTRMAA